MTQSEQQRVEEIAGKLTKAQREAMRTNPWRAQDAGESHIPFCTQARCRAALQDKGLVEYPMYSTRLTPLGIAVRTHLLEQAS